MEAALDEQNFRCVDITNPAGRLLIEQHISKQRVAVQQFARTVNGVLDIGVGAHQIRAQTRTVTYN